MSKKLKKKIAALEADVDRLKSVVGNLQDLMPLEGGCASRAYVYRIAGRCDDLTARLRAVESVAPRLELIEGGPDGPGLNRVPEKEAVSG